jgi:hypothetical protein
MAANTQTEAARDGHPLRTLSFEQKQLKHVRSGIFYQHASITRTYGTRFHSSLFSTHKMFLRNKIHGFGYSWFLILYYLRPCKFLTCRKKDKPRHALDKVRGHNYSEENF